MENLASHQNETALESHRQLTDAELASRADLIISLPQQRHFAMEEGSSRRQSPENQDNHAALRKKVKKARSLKSLGQKRDSSTAVAILDRAQPIHHESKIVSCERYLHADEALVVNNAVIQINNNVQETLQTNPQVVESKEPKKHLNALKSNGGTEDKNKRRKTVPLWKILILIFCCPLWMVYLCMTACCGMHKATSDEDNDSEQDSTQVAYYCGCTICVGVSLECLPKLC